MADGFNNRPGVAQSIVDNAISGNIGGIFSTKQTAKYATGPRTILRMNGNVVGFAFGVSWHISTDQTEINTIDDYLPYEYAPRRVTVDGTMSFLHIPGQSAGTKLWQADVLAFLFQKYISIEVRDSRTDQLLFATDKAVVTGRTEESRVEQLNNVTLTWKAIGFIDERPPALPTNYNQPSPVKGNQTPLETAFNQQNIA
jgi:hypothetical protein